MGYYLKKQGLSGRVVYWTGNKVWSDDISKKQLYASEESIETLIKNEDGRNGGFSGTQIVSE
tara:strand:- start:1774 stop:1959 length:186 start_codon:yes stop_codon:yes gene_type:complete